MKPLGNSLPERGVFEGFEFGLLSWLGGERTDPLRILLRDHIVAIGSRHGRNIQNGAAWHTERIAVAVSRLLGELPAEAVNFSGTKTGAVQKNLNAAEFDALRSIGRRGLNLCRRSLCGFGTKDRQG